MMPEPNDRPIVFLAFSNNSASSEHYLRNLDDEAEQTYSALSQAEKRGHCEVVIRKNATADDVLDLFQDANCRDRVAIFHFGGHANSFQLLLETSAGKSFVADGQALASFLAHQDSLQVIFLNGCSTEGHVVDLLDSGVNAVIATERAIDDALATAFSTRFYQSLTGGAAIGAAFAEAAAAAQFEQGGVIRHLGAADEVSERSDVRVPWHLHVRPGAEAVKDWSLPLAVNDPLFGLPSLPANDLPASPFLYLNWYDRDHAEVFFGRGNEIRDLFQRVTDPRGAPIILLYSQSGAGKSSLLAAGLLPRLEQEYAVIYARRIADLGLAGTLRTALAGHLSLPEATTGADWALWHTIEERADKPLIIVLDQVEEAYIQPCQNEVAEFMDLVRQFVASSKHSKSRLILSFRKEWLAEQEKRLVELRLPYGKVFLERLDKRGVEEAVSGLTRNERLRQHYNLMVQPELPTLIADDLLEDAGSAVAPTLQVLLTKLWQRAMARDGEDPKFDSDLYQELKREGLLLKDFLDQQLHAVELACPEEVVSGLALDLLVFHTTTLGTAEQHTLQHLRNEYSHCEPSMLKLIAACKDHYLLVDPAGSHDDQVTRLAHDTLAPVMREVFAHSQKPGQVGRRILENQTAEWMTSGGKSVLDRWALEKIDASRGGMRTITKEEALLLDASRKKIDEFKPPILEERIFPPGLQVRKFIPGKVLNVRPYGGSCAVMVMAVILSVFLSIGLSFLLYPLLLLLSPMLGSVADSPVLRMLVSILRYSTTLAAVYYLLFRRRFVSFDLVAKKIGTSFMFAKNKDQVLAFPLTHHAVRSAKGFIGELRCGGLVIARTAELPSEEVVRQELTPFGDALDFAMGYATYLAESRLVETATQETQAPK